MHHLDGIALEHSAISMRYWIFFVYAGIGFVSFFSEKEEIPYKLVTSLPLYHVAEYSKLTEWAILQLRVRNDTH